MTERIRILDDALADQIAAGEVVERPSSVVKELLENALDADACSVQVHIEGAGLELIRVSDDGRGMSAADARLSVLRHATSKLAKSEDLQSIATLGFRGEALPSIASVSRLSISTRAAEDVAGTRVVVEGGADAQTEEVGRAPGTTVEVKDLFFNVPARRKFLKSAATERAHIMDVCTRMALAFPALRLELVREGKRAREFLPLRSTCERAQAIFAKDQLRAIECELDGLYLRAALGPPERSRSGMGGLHLFVNRRPIRHPALARAVAFAYGSVLPPGRYPVGVLQLELDPGDVDVNVHPQKLEVRFVDQRHVLESVTRALAKELGSKPGWDAARDAAPPRPPDYWSRRLGQAPDTTHTALAAHDGGGDPWGLRGEAPAEAPTDAATDASAALPREASLFAPTGFFSSLRVLGQIRRMLLVCEGADALHIIDQHAADERVRFARFRDSYLRGAVQVQRLLFPQRVECTESDVERVCHHQEQLVSMGLECAAVGRTTLAIHATPALLSRAAPERLLRDVLDELGHEGSRAFGDALDTAIATMACHAAIRAGDELSAEQSAALLASLDEVQDFAGHCPHGRPVVHTIGIGELERRLGR